MPIWSQINLQDSNSSVMENLIMFYDHAMLVLVMIIMLIMYMLTNMLMNKFINRFMYEGQLIEIIWTVIPMGFLFFIAIPSLKILYLTDEIINPEMSIKIIGHQWYWSYEYSDFKNIAFDSFMMDKNNKNLNNMFRLLDVDNRMILPISSNIRMLINSSDVIHSFALPSIGIKIDAVPGRINQVMINIIRPGLYYGQCSEICGVNHSFMPIVLESISLKMFLKTIHKL